MKNIESDFSEFVLSAACHIFEIEIPAKFTWQKIAFANICMENFLSEGGFLTEKSIDCIKEEFLSWQNKSSPSIDFIEKDVLEFTSISTFSHDDDYKWNDLNKPIFRYISEFISEVGCDTYQDFLRKEYLENKNESRTL